MRIIPCVSLDLAVCVLAVLVTCIASDIALAAGPQYSYDVYHYSEMVPNWSRPDPRPVPPPPVKSYRLAIPKGVTTVKGILVVSNCMGGDSLDWYKGTS